MKDGFITNEKGFFPEGMTQGQKILMGFVLFMLLVFVYMLVRGLLGHTVALPAVPGGLYGKVILLCAMTFLYFAYMRGWKTAIFFIVFLSIYAWASEELSIHTGFPYGHYYYSDMLGFKIDVTPALLGLNYFWVLIVPAYFVSNLLVEGSPFSTSKTWKKMLFTAFVCSIVVSAIDMVVDPLDATKVHEWVWTKNNYVGYYGIPYVNYLGYIIAVTPAMFILKYFENKFDAKPIGPVTKMIVSIPLICYFLTLLLYGLPAPAGVILVGCFTMGFPLILSIDKLNKYFSGQ
jgi:putative membrane protein